MKFFKTKATKKRLDELRDLQLRGEAIAVSMQHSRGPAQQTVQNTLRGAQMIYSWMKGHGLPIDSGGDNGAES